MKCRCQLNLLLDPKRNPEALPELLATLGQCCSTGPKSALYFHLSVGRNQSALSMLVQDLPATAKGFSLARYGAPIPAAASELAAATAAGKRIPAGCYDGELLEHFNLAAGLQLIGR